MKKETACPEEILSRKDELTKNMERLSNELKVGMVIYRMDIMGMRPYFSCLVKVLDGIMEKNVVSQALDTLEDWIMIKGEYGETYGGRAGYIYTPDYLDMAPEHSKFAELEKEINKKD